MTHIFILNLKRSPHRKQHMQRQLDKIGMAYTFIESIDGKNVPLWDFPAYNSQHRIARFGRDLQNTEVATVLSHLKALKYAKAHMTKTDESWAIILEDDGTLDTKFKQSVQALDSLPPQVESVRLCGYHIKPSHMPTDGFVFCRSTYKHWFGAWGYAVRVSAIDKYTENALPIVHIADKMLFGVPAYDVKVYQMSPPTIYVTDTIPSDIEYTHQHAYKGIRNKITRLTFRIRENKNRWWYVATHIHEYLSKY